MQVGVSPVRRAMTQLATVDRRALLERSGAMRDWLMAPAPHDEAPAAAST
jgi:hypothetical protein